MPSGWIIAVASSCWNGEGRLLLGEGSEMRTDGVLHGGDGGVTASVVAAGAGGYRGHAGAVRVDIELHVRDVLRIQRAFASIRLQELAHRYSSGFLYQISYHYLYAPFYLFF